MFLAKTLERNPTLIGFGFKAIKDGLLLPDTYLIDLDTVRQNGKDFLTAAQNRGLHSYAMLKQAGRNPVIAKILEEIGFEGTVSVDFEEALSYIPHGLKLGHVGHLVQIPKHALHRILEVKPEIITVYSIENAKAISDLANELDIEQKIMLRVLERENAAYAAQQGGFSLSTLADTAKKIMHLKNISICGVTSFPCFLFNEENKQIESTPNVKSVQNGAAILRTIGCEITQLNMPSANCIASLDLAKAEGATHVEPGHALFGSTPWHTRTDAYGEKPAMIYLSEISHNYAGHGYCYGGGMYRRGHLQEALVGKDLEHAKKLRVSPFGSENIDYHFELSESCPVFEPVVMAFRSQIFVTRSRVALVEGLSQGDPRLRGIYTALGQKV